MLARPYPTALQLLTLIRVLLLWFPDGALVLMEHHASHPRDTVSVGWDGRLYDCDFNQQLELAMMQPSAQGPTQHSGSGSSSGSEGSSTETHSPGGGGGGGGTGGVKSTPTVFSVGGLDELTGWTIRADNHCFGCTAGSGSSCTGATL